jgi:hypothetical protein
MRIVLPVVAVALSLAPVAWSSSVAFTTCGIVSGGGVKWKVVATQVSCSVAKPLVSKLAAKPHPTLPTRLGTHLGLKCVEYARNGTREIGCIGGGGRKTVYGVTPPHK